MPAIYNTTLVLSQVLPAAGAVVTSSAIAINTFNEVTPILSYTRGGAGGSVNIVVEYSTELDPLNFYQLGEIQAPALVPGANIQIPLQRASFLYTSTSALAELVTLPKLSVVGTKIRFKLNEVGAVGTPGTVTLELYTKGEQ